ncbi:hypothetical protein D1871_16310 [Nakamurella silvestris]|nr:hypothetical protein D1871_16310 [Nakamurella silvestris]
MASLARLRATVTSGFCALLVAALFVSGTTPAGAVPPPPVNPSDDDISQSESDAASRAAEVGRLSGLVTQTEGEIDRLNNDMELKAELAMKAKVDLEVAVEDAADAKKAAATAAEVAAASQQDIDLAQDKAKDFAAASFQQGSRLGSLSALLDSGTLNDLLERQQLIGAISESQLDVINELQRARVNKANLDAAARQAVIDADAAQQAADQAAKDATDRQNEANDAFAAGQARLGDLRTQLDDQQIAYTAAVNTVAVLKSQRDQYNQWVELKRAEEERLRKEAEERARIAAEKIAAEKAAAQAAAEKAAADRLAAAQAEEERQRQAAVVAAEKLKKENERKALLAAAEEKIRKAQQAAADAEAAAQAAEALQRANEAKQAAEAKRLHEAQVAKEARAAARRAQLALEEAQREKDAFDARTEAQRRADEAKEAAEGNNSGWDPNVPDPDPVDTPDPVTPTVPVNPTPNPNPSTGSSRGDIIVNAGLRWLGTTYAWGGGDSNGPTYGIRDYGVADSYGDYMKIGFDCSGLALYAYAQVGIYLPHYSGYQYQQGQRISQNDLQRGDLVFWANNTSDPNTIHHVAIWMGDGNILEAPQSGSTVKISPMRWNGYIGASRPGT